MAGTWEIYKNFRFEAAHTFPNVGEDHPCRRMHGHSWQVRIFVTGQVNEETGWIMDFADIKAAFAPILKELDHSYLNDLPGLENPTSENLARWIWKRLSGNLSGLSGVLVRETITSGALYRETPE